MPPYALFRALLVTVPRDGFSESSDCAWPVWFGWNGWVCFLIALSQGSRSHLSTQVKRSQAYGCDPKARPEGDWKVHRAEMKLLWDKGTGSVTFALNGLSVEISALMVYFMFQREDGFTR